MHIHLIAIGGSAMHSLALALRKQGHTVTGSDDEIYNPARDRLAHAGLLPANEGWNPERIHSGLDAIILGMHARIDNPELQQAQELGLRVYSYPEFIREQTANKIRVVVAGSHGKTSTTAMLMHFLASAGRDFDYLIGAPVKGFDDTVRLSNAPLMLIEGDEYLSSPIDRRSKFLHYDPDFAILTGIAWDHMNVFPSFDSYLQTFKSFLSGMHAQSQLFYYANDQFLKELVPPNFSGKARTYAALQTDRPLKVFGKHNLENMEAAMLVGEALGLEREQMLEAAASFEGANRRLQVLAESDSRVAFLDFAHAPSKVAATVQAVREHFPNKKLYAALELHTYSSLNKDFIGQYSGSLELADAALVYYDAHTLEMKKMPELTTEEVFNAFGKPGMGVANNRIDLENTLSTWLQTPGDSVLLLMSSGRFAGLDLQTMATQWVRS